MVKKSKLSISLVIPSYNNEDTIVNQIKACEKILLRTANKFEIVVKDDASKDGTWNLLLKNFGKKGNFRLLQNKKNQGITRNVHDLYMLARLDYALFYSADGDWNPQNIEGMIGKAGGEKLDIVIGKRTAKLGYTFYRQIISFFHHLLPLLVFGVETYDPGGIKLIRRDLAQAKLVSKSQFFEAEIIIRAKRAGCKISWFPVSYKKPHSGAGKGGALHSAMASLVDVFRLRLSLP